jgi:GNAT superfamily N-acetyltransferase
MTPTRLRATDAKDLADLSAVCLRSKGHWGYDADFLAACRDDLTVSNTDLAGYLAVTGPKGARTGVVTVLMAGPIAHLDKLFVDPSHLGQGLGRALMLWAVAQAKTAGATEMRIEADPFAEGFYTHFGATKIGETPSTVFPDRRLPLMRIAF